MILASHNSMTYLKPKYWVLRLFRWIYRCQTKTIEEQYEAGVRYFDFRISFDHNGIPRFRHGLVVFKSSDVFILNILKWLNEKDDVIIRMVFEKDLHPEDSTIFKVFCQEVQEAYKNITFTCGENVKTKEVLYNFGTTVKLPVYERYSSVIGSKLNGLWPWKFAKENNEKFINEYKNKDCYLMIDFI